MLLAKVLLRTITVYNLSMGLHVNIYNLDSVRDILNWLTTNYVRN